MNRVEKIIVAKYCPNIVFFVSKSNQVILQLQLLQPFVLVPLQKKLVIIINQNY
jgi:hypothetical protein